MSSEKRRDLRYPIRLPVTLRSGGRTRDLFTEDVSLRGLFVRTDDPPGLRQLLEVELTLPPGSERFRCHGMSVFVTEPNGAGGRLPGAGIQFYAMGENSRVWRRFVEQVREQAIPPRNLVSVPPPPVEEPKAAPRPSSRPVVIAVRPQTIEALLMLYTREVAQGGMFLNASDGPPVGSEIRVDVVHPETRDTFVLRSVVRRRDREGIAVDFLDLDEVRRLDFYQFVFVGAGFLDVDDPVAAAS